MSAPYISFEQGSGFAATTGAPHVPAQSVQKIIASRIAVVNGERRTLSSGRVDNSVTGPEEKPRSYSKAFLLAITNPSWIAMNGNAKIKVNQRGICMGEGGVPKVLAITFMAAS